MGHYYNDMCCPDCGGIGRPCTCTKSSDDKTALDLLIEKAKGGAIVSDTKRFEATFLVEGVMGGKTVSSGICVLASDYDREVRALESKLVQSRAHCADAIRMYGDVREELDNMKRSWGLLHSERDALAAYNQRLRDALERISMRCQAFIEDDCAMQVHSLEVMDGIACAALAGSKDYDA